MLQSVRFDVLAVTPTAQGAEDSGRWERFCTASSKLGSMLDAIRQTLGASKVVEAEFSDSLIRQIQQAAEDSLREYAPETDFSLGLFGWISAEDEDWVSVWSSSGASREDWLWAGKTVVSEFEDWQQGHSLAGSTTDLADRGIIANDLAENLLRVDAQGVVVRPVRAPNGTGEPLPCLAFVGLTSDVAFFADDLVRRLVEQTISLLEVVIAVGRRDEILLRRLAGRREDAPGKEF